MEKMVHNRRYNTDTSDLLGSWTNNSQEESSYFVEELYQKRSGEYFLYGKGGSKSRFAKQVGSQWLSGEKFIPLTWDEAKAWSEKHLSPEEYEMHFGDITMTDERQTFAVYISTGTIQQIRRSCAKSGKSMSAYIENLVWEDVRKRGD